MQKLKQLNSAIYSDIVKQYSKNYKNYAQELMEVLIQCKDIPECKNLLAITFYNLGKLSSRYRFIHTSLQFKQAGIERVKWNLQMLALASSRDNHQEAYAEACKLIVYITDLINGLQLQSQHLMLAREIVELVQRPKNNNINTAKTLNQLQLGRKFQTNCPYVNKTFHIADIMIIEPINIALYHDPPKLKPDEELFYYIVFLSIASFTRATQKFYCRDSTDKEYHFKAIQMTGYLYSSKSTYMRFLKRTYKEHYLQRLEDIEEVDELGELKVRVPVDPQEINMTRMPWDAQQEEQQTQQADNVQEIQEVQNTQQIQNTKLISNNSKGQYYEINSQNQKVSQKQNVSNQKAEQNENVGGIQNKQQIEKSTKQQKQ